MEEPGDDESDDLLKQLQQSRARIKELEAIIQQHEGQESAPAGFSTVVEVPKDPPLISDPISCFKKMKGDACTKKIPWTPPLDIIQSGIASFLGLSLPHLSTHLSRHCCGFCSQ